MQHVTNFRTFNARVASLGLTPEDIVKVSISAIHIDRIAEMVAWCSDHPLERPFLYTAYHGRHRDDPDRTRIYEVELHLLDADAAFEAKLRFG